MTPESTSILQLVEERKPVRISWPALISAWPDALAFAIGLAAARWAGWSSGDLIWSLWLSSLFVGYSSIVWIILGPTAVLSTLALRSRNDLPNTPSSGMRSVAAIVIGAAVMLAFFSVHFLGFHYVHSKFLLDFFPIKVPGVAHPEMGGRAVYLEVLRRYWIFLPSAFLSHRGAFVRPRLTLDAESWFKSFAGNGKGAGQFIMGPYKNVLRMHGLILFFAFAHFAGLETFAVYAVVYAVYFFPWRLVRSVEGAAS